MDDICRLCCSTKFVNNYIFDEENALYLKMSLYLPIKVFKNDRLPQKICDKCSCKVNDFYQFCNEAIEVQNSLRSTFLSSNITANESIDLTLIKENVNSPPPPVTTCEQSTQTETNTVDTSISTGNNVSVKVKEEPKAPSPPTVKTEDESVDSDNCDVSNDILSDDSDDLSLVNLKKRKRHKKDKLEVTNGQVIDNKRERKKKQKLKEWEMLASALPEGISLTVVDKTKDSNNKVKLDVVKREMEVTFVKPQELGMGLSQLKKTVKKEPDEMDIYHCCICFTQCYSRSEMLQHYRQHASESEASSAPPATPPLPPDAQPLRCTRCQKVLEPAAWASHWRRHWERDSRPYHCALCEKTFRNHHQILKHGLTHKEGTNTSQSLGKRFVCDLCPEGFVYMRYLQAHRSRAHPEAASRSLVLCCVHCGRQFAHLNSLRRHLRAHTGERNFLCNVCGKALSSREHLKFHIRIHTGYKPNVCKTCGKGFAKKCNLTLHERVHSGEKPHVCSHCGKAFSQRSTLVIHERYHSGARPYVCAACGRGFVAKGLLSMHLKSTCK